MLKQRCLVMAMTFGALSFGAVGCDLFSISGALTKLANCEIGALTATEIRTLSEATADLINTQDPTANASALTLEQAQAIVNFLAANNVNDCDDFQNLLILAEQDPDSLQGLDELAAAFQDSDDSFDPENVSRDDLQEIFDFF